MKVAKVLPKNPTLEEQVKLLKRVVLIKHEDFAKDTTGIIVSMITMGRYWVFIDVPFKTKSGHWAKRKPFKPEELRLL